MADPLAAVSGRRAELLSAGRIASAGLLLGPGASKFLAYRRSVQFFATLGLPAADVLVIVVGIVELAAAGLFLANRRTRLAALLVLPIMAVAVVTAGPTWQNVGLLGLALGIIGVETAAGSDTVAKSTG